MTLKIPVTAADNQGFTLVELLIAITMLGLISVVTYSSIWTVSRGLEKVERRVDARDDIRVTFAFLQRTLAEARGVMVITDERMRLLFSGEADELTFVAPAPLQLGSSGGLYRYQIKLSKSVSGGNELRLSYWQYFAGREVEENLEPLGTVTLLKAVDSVDFSFFGKEEPWQKDQWLREWSNGITMPRLVKVSLVTESTDIDQVMTFAIKGSGA